MSTFSTSSKIPREREREKKQSVITDSLTHSPVPVIFYQISLLGRVLSGFNHSIHFISQETVHDDLDTETYFHRWNRIVNSNLLDTVCTFLTSDLLITGLYLY